MRQTPRFAQPKEAFISHADTDHYNALPGLIRPGGIELTWHAAFRNQFLHGAVLGQNEVKA